MKKLFDLIAIFSGIIGMGRLLIMMGDLTPETATLHSARAIVVIAFVVVPFFIARAIEKTSFSSTVTRMLPVRKRRPQPTTETTYFDYLFQPGSAYDWRSDRVASLQSKRNNDNARNAEM